MKDLLKLFFLCALISGCASIKTHTPLSLSVEKFVSQQKKRGSVLDGVSGLLQVRYTLRNLSMAGGAKWVKFKNRSRFEVSDPMGRVRYWLLKDAQTSIAFYETEKQAYLAEQDGFLYFKKFFNLPLSHEDVLKLWVGILPDSWLQKLPSHWESERSGYQARIELESGSVSFNVSDQNGLLSEIHWKSGSREIRVSYSDFDACCATDQGESTLAHVVVIKLPDASEKIELEWEELNILDQAPNPLAWSRKLPKGTRTIRLN